MSKAVYFHIPFCEQICHYCDFNKVFLKNQPVNDYLDAMAMEMRNTVQRFGNRKMKTMYVGGGTPTSLNLKQLDKFLKSIHETFTLVEEYEFTVEANPSNVDLDKLKLLKKHGVNRLSIGVQSFDDGLLQKIGRDHNKDEIYMIIENARNAGFDNISIDLMFGLPTQTLEKFEQSIDKARSLQVEHVSTYGLQVEPKTIFYNQMRKGKLMLPSEETEVSMFELLIQKMITHGFHHYEISNFALPGKESQHNLTYWNNEDYYGIGAGAHSYVNGVRRKNAGPLKHYMNRITETNFPYVEEINVSDKEKMEEELFLGLRKRAGVSKRVFYEKYKRTLDEVYGETIANLVEKGLLEDNGDWIRLTDKGVFLGNEVFQAFLE
ncbi:radical SAM family heme chaperone HemW [Pueribacillus sp. YX66]|uniref:radical SAM family heme chaperone HemW n=1 Tax=Pueribacillus sp. YX66 TaxID=3229242 RepID=UPI00358D9CD3